ncbi:MAG: RNA methyltransferase [Cyclobacteriaceae bacterium]|nr:RNA methyltransferase [Cyclobacteriaceae bacterium]
MISKAKVKFMKSLQLKKYRKQEQRFLVEGAKSVAELLASDFEVTQVVGTAAFLNSLSPTVTAEQIEATEAELAALGEFQSNNTALAIARMKPNRLLEVSEKEFAIVLDDIRDPGNLGTIIRTADWYGIHKIIASSETADFYNPKVITATMGSFTRVEICYTQLPEYLAIAKHTVWGAYLDGSNVHTTDFGEGGLILIGNESRGIAPELQHFVTQKVTIPRYGKAESLNAAIATAVICDNIRRMSGM